jgi:hypothetical protein
MIIAISMKICANIIPAMFAEELVLASLTLPSRRSRAAAK